RGAGRERQAPNSSRKAREGMRDADEKNGVSSRQGWGWKLGQILRSSRESKGERAPGPSPNANSISPAQTSLFNAGKYLTTLKDLTSIFALTLLLAAVLIPRSVGQLAVRPHAPAGRLSSTKRR
ncbi:MAG TPA: hypothetical protein VKA63_03520, partial [Candidatus Krumholzibacteria bacterium]|nr:hypothetical protein [Candidatus Krumholzibacteria bacterium]